MNGVILKLDALLDLDPELDTTTGCLNERRIHQNDLVPVFIDVLCFSKSRCTQFYFVCHHSL